MALGDIIRGIFSKSKPQNLDRNEADGVTGLPRYDCTAKDICIGPKYISTVCLFVLKMSPGDLRQRKMRLQNTCMVVIHGNLQVT